MVSQNKAIDNSIDRKNWGFTPNPAAIKAQDKMDLDPFEYTLYALIVRRAWGSGKCWESVERLSEDCNMGSAKGKRALKRLEDLRMIRVERRKGQTSLLHPVGLHEWRTPGEVPRTKAASNTGSKKVQPSSQGTNPRINQTQVPRINSTQPPTEPRINSTQVPRINQTQPPRINRSHKEYSSEDLRIEEEVLRNSVKAAALNPDPEPPLLLKNFPEPDPEARQGATQLGSEPTHPAQDFGQASRPQPRTDLKLGMGGERSPYAGGPPRTKVVFRAAEPEMNWASKAPWGDERTRQEFDEYLRMVYSKRRPSVGNIGGYVAAVISRIAKEGADPSGQDAWADFVKAKRSADLTGGEVQQFSPEEVEKILGQWSWITRDFPPFTPELFADFPLAPLWVAEMGADSEAYSRECRGSLLRRMFVGWREYCYPDCPDLAAYKAGPKYKAPVVSIRQYAGAGQVVHR